jgi:hypothetical protein
MSKCLTDSEVNAFVDGVSENTVEIVEHLNNCSACYQDVSELMNLIEENKDAYDQLNTSYEKMVSVHLVGAYYRRYKKYLSHFIKNFIPSSLEGILPSSIGQNTASVFGFNRYSVIGIAFLVAMVAVTVQSPFIAENDTSEKKLINASHHEKLESDLKGKETDTSEVEQFKSGIKDYESDPDKKNAVELGKIVMKMKAASLFEEKEKLKIYLKDLISNPLVNKNDAQSQEEVGDINKEDVNKIIDLYLKGIDMKLKPYFDYGLEVEKSKIQSENIISN